MLVGQQLGPFLIDKELGSGAMGAVYRGRYVQTGQVVAVKVMAPGLGSTTGHARARFEREANILKQLNHPNIVRLFGVGKSHGTRYYAMEYIEGESLDHVMARRDRMTWEEVVELGLQLCSALQHAHEAGIVHRDLKPSNLMVLRDGTVKLTDFGIAKDLDVTQLTGANCTVGTAAYMSPEQCRGEKDLTYKSDLYSLGVVFFELLTGRRPFESDNAMEMFLHHVQTVPERPSRLALETPVWLDTLITQLLEKKPEHRPRDAAMVAEVLASIQEKVEAQQSAGVDAVKARRGDRPREEREKVTDEDRRAARSLAGRKGKKKPAKQAVHELVWFRAVGLCVLLGAVLGGIVWLLQPPSADDLYAEAERLLKAENPDRHAEAREKPITQYLARFGDRKDAKSEQVRKWAEEYDVAWYEKLIDRHLKHQREKKGLPVTATSESDEQAFKAAGLELDGDRDAAAKLWQQVLDRDKDVGMGLVARRHLAALAGIDDELKRFDVLQLEVRRERAEPKLDDLRQRAFSAYRREKLGDRVAARKAYEALGEAATREASRPWQIFAAVRARVLKDSLAEKPQEEKERVELLAALLAQTKANRELALLDRWVVGHEIVLLYEKDEAMADVVKQAREMVEAVNKTLGPAGR